MTAQPLAVEHSAPATFEQAQDVLAASLPGYERRPQQMALGLAIETAFLDEHNYVRQIIDPEDDQKMILDPDYIPTHVMGQAGCGCGKSLAYLIPAIQMAAHDHRRVMISVTTKALQDQIIGTDLPFLEAHLGIDFKWALLKGRSNYLCHDRLLELGDPELIERVRRLASNPRFDGGRDHFADLPGYVWSRICSDQDSCNSCDMDYATRARTIAKDADIVVINHALLCADMAIAAKTGQTGGGTMLGRYDAVVLDECHTFEEVAAGALGKNISVGSFTQHTSEVRNFAGSYTEQGVDFVSESVTAVEQATYRFFDRLTPGRLRVPAINDLVGEIGDLFDALTSLKDAQWELKLAESARDDDVVTKRQTKTRATIVGLIESLRTLVFSPEHETVRWVDETPSKRDGEPPRKVLNMAPIDVGPFLHKHLYNQTLVIHTSATMKVKGSFDHLAGRLGIRKYVGIDVGTPFDFESQASLYVPVALPEPTNGMQQTWEVLANEEIIRLIEASKGKALVLFTSVKHMRSAAELVRMRSRIEIKVQGEESHQDLIDWLKDHEGNERAIFATKSFFTGVDIRGEACRLVIVTKMPFPVPTEPITQARCEVIEARGGSSFNSYSIPVMSLELQQGAGRLIRHTNDRGVIAILDPRILTKNYGKTIVRDLPKMPQMYEIPQVEAFFAATD